MRSDLVSIVVPCFNEESSLDERMRDLLGALASWKRDFELILVNDGSTDGTEDVARGLAAGFAQVRAVSYRHNRGRGHAMRKGFDVARGGIVVTTEADLTWGAEIVRRMVEALEASENDMVVASPYAAGGRLVNVPLHRALISRIGNRVLSATLPAGVTMVSGMTRAYRREVLDAVDLEADGKEIHVEILLKALVLGFRVGELPATLKWSRSAARQGEGRQTFHARKVILNHATLWLFEKPMAFFGLLGSFLLLTGIAFGLYVATLRYTGGLTPNRPLISAIVILVLGGFQVLAFGFLAGLVTRLRHELVRVQRGNRTILRRLDDQADTLRIVRAAMPAAGVPDPKQDTGPE